MADPLHLRDVSDIEGPVADAVRALADARQALDAAERAIADIDDVTGLLCLRDRFHADRVATAGFEKALEARAIALLGDARGFVEVDGFGAVKVTSSYSRKNWAHDNIRGAWLDAWMTAEGGAIPDDPAEVIAAFCEFAQVNGYRSGTAKTLGIDLDGYCDAEAKTGLQFG